MKLAERVIFKCNEKKIKINFIVRQLADDILTKRIAPDIKSELEELKNNAEMSSEYLQELLKIIKAEKNKKLDALIEQIEDLL